MDSIENILRKNYIWRYHMRAPVSILTCASESRTESDQYKKRFSCVWCIVCGWVMVSQSSLCHVFADHTHSGTFIASYGVLGKKKWVSISLILCVGQYSEATPKEMRKWTKDVETRNFKIDSKLPKYAIKIRERIAEKIVPCAVSVTTARQPAYVICAWFRSCSSRRV